MGKRAIEQAAANIGTPCRERRTSKAQNRQTSNAHKANQYIYTSTKVTKQPIQRPHVAEQPTIDNAPLPPGLQLSLDMPHSPVLQIKLPLQLGAYILGSLS